MKIETRDFAPHVVRLSWEEPREPDCIGPRVNAFSLVIKFGLHWIKGNRAPYFSITADGWENGRESFGGACHDIIAERAPGLADVIALHLSDMDGAPMHAEGNGLYWLGGIVGGFVGGSKYHGGSGSSAKTATQCAAIFADHARVTEAEAYSIAGNLNRLYKSEGGKAAAESEFKRWTDGQRKRWKAEADALIRKYGLGIYGDIHKTPAEVLANLGA